MPLYFPAGRRVTDPLPSDGNRLSSEQIGQQTGRATDFGPVTRRSRSRLRQKPVQGCLTLLKTNLKHFLNVTFWLMGSYACVVQAAPMRNWWPFPASGVDFVPRAVGGTWRRRPLTWLIVIGINAGNLIACFSPRRFARNQLPNVFIYNPRTPTISSLLWDLNKVTNYILKLPTLFKSQ